MKKIKIEIEIISIIIIILLITLLNIKKKNNGEDLLVNNLINNTNEIPNKNNPEDNIDYTINPTISNKLESVTINKEYMTIETLFKSFIENARTENKEYLLDVLSKDYIEKYNVTSENIIEKINIKAANDFQYHKIVVTEMMKCRLNNEYMAYIVAGKYRITDQTGTYSLKLLIIINSADKTYSIYPQQFINDNRYANLKTGDNFIINNYEIEKNKNNTFNYVIKQSLEIVEKYFKDYKELLQYYPAIAYQKLNKDYLIKRFNNNQNEFFNYLANNKSIIGTSIINNYKTEKETNYIDYLCSDQYNNAYIFRITNGDLANYEVFLDDYTIRPEYEIKRYNELDDFQKARECAKIFENMLLTRDYTAIYNILDNTFRANNFENLEKLKNYLESNIYRINAIEITDFNMDDTEIFVYPCELQNKENSNESKNMTIVIKPGEGTTFTMSFSFN